MLPTRSSAGRAQSARRARSSCSWQLPVGSIVSTFTQVPGLEETGRSKKTKEQRCLNSSTNILSHLDKRHSRKTSIIAVQLLLQNTHSFSMHTHIQHPAVQPVSRARRGCIVVSSQTSTEFLMLEYQLWERKLSQAYFKPNLLFGIHVINYS